MRLIANTLWDIRLVTRALLRARTFTAITVTTLAIGLAVPTLVFSVVNAVFYRALPYPDSDRMVTLSSISPAGFHDWSAQPIEVVDRIRRYATAYDRVGVFREESTTLESDSGRIALKRTAIDTSVIGLVGIRASRGRLLSPREILTDAPVALISDSLWRTQFGQRDVIGEWVTTNERRVEIVGILPPGVRFYKRSDLLVPLREPIEASSPDTRSSYSVIARLRPGVDIAVARQEIARIGTELARVDSRFRGWRLTVESGMFDRGARQAQFMALVVLALTCCLLLVACANTSTLLLVRSAHRINDAVVRIALGAPRGRVMATQLLESVVLCAAGTVLGLGLAVVGMKVLVTMVPLNLPSWIRLGVDWHVLVFAAGAAAVASFGIVAAPVSVSLGADPAQALREGAVSVTSARATVSRGVNAVTLQVGVMVVVGACGALFWRSYTAITTTDLGYDAAEVRNIRLSVGPKHAQGDILAQLARGLSLNPSVTSVAVRGGLNRFLVDERAGDSLNHDDPSPGDFELYSDLSGDRPAESDRTHPSQRFVVSDSYFRTIGLRLVAGTGFDDRIQRGTAPVVVVSRSLAQMLWPGLNPLGRTLRVGVHGTPASVIGVAEDTREVRRESSGVAFSPQRVLYVSERQAEPANPAMLARTANDVSPLRVAASLNQLIRSLGVDATVVGAATLAEETASAFSDLRLLGRLLLAVTLLGISVAGAGIYGVVASGVETRIREIGVRGALGATPWQIMTHLAAGGMRAISAGVVLGTLIAAIAQYVLNLISFSVRPVDAWSLALAAATVMVLTLGVCFVAASRAVRIGPAQALRS
jgi:predicted permease